MRSIYVLGWLLLVVVLVASVDLMRRMAITRGETEDVHDALDALSESSSLASDIAFLPDDPDRAGARARYEDLRRSRDEKVAFAHALGLRCRDESAGPKIVAMATELETIAPQLDAAVLTAFRSAPSAAQAHCIEDRYERAMLGGARELSTEIRENLVLQHRRATVLFVVLGLALVLSAVQIGVIRAATRARAQLACAARELEEGRAVLAAKNVELVAEAARRETAEAAMRARSRQQAAVARLTHRALADMDAPQLFKVACETVAELLAASFCQIVELAAGAGRPGVRASVGCVPESPELASGMSSVVGLAAANGVAVLTDAARDGRVGARGELARCGVASCVATLIGEAGKPYGALIAGFSASRDISEADTSFLQAIARVLAIAVDRRRRHDALVASEARLQDFLETATDLIHIAAPDGRILYANKAWRDALGYTAEEASRLTVWDLVAPEHRERCHVVRDELMASEVGRHVDVDFIARDGRRIRIEGAVSCRREHGFVVATRGIFRDVTEQRRLEEELRVSRQLEVVGRFAGGLAHDLNNAVTAVNGYSELLIAERAPGDPTRKLLEKILSSGARVAALTRELLSFGRGRVLRSEPVDLAAMARLIAKEPPVELAGRDVRVDARDEARATADPAELDRALRDLVGFAASVAAPDVPVRVSLSSTAGPRGEAVLAVEAAGSPLPADELQRVFDPYSSARRTAKKGIGLAAAYGAIHQMHGRVTAASSPGIAVTFTVAVPLACRDAVVPVTPRTRRSADGAVLVVDDEVEVRDLAAAILRRAGYEVLVASDGPTALELARTSDVRLLLTDVVMPGMNGSELATRMRAEHEGLLVLYMSGYTQGLLGESGNIEPGTLVIEKPFTSESLLEVVRKALDPTARMTLEAVAS